MRNWSSMTTPPDLSSFNTAAVTDVAYMMYNWASMGAIDIPIDTWDIGAVINITSFLSGSQLITVCYDRVLAAWSVQTLAVSTLDFHFGTSTYTDTTSRAALLAKCNSIIDGGLA